MLHLCRALAPAAAALLLLAGCDNDPNPIPVRLKRADGSPWVVRYSAMPDDPRSLDPQQCYDQMGHRLLEPVEDCLLEYNPFKTDPYELSPCLLEAMPQRTENANGTVDYLCHLKPGILYHDDPCFPGGKGREVVAQDVEFAWQRMCDPKVECPVVSALGDCVTGMMDAYNAARKSGAFNYAKPIAGLEVVDAHTFKIHLSKRYPQIVYWLAMHFTTPDGPDGGMVRHKEFKWHPVGDGPFRLDLYEPSNRVRLVRNPNYHTTVFPSTGFPPDKAEWLKQFAGHQLPLIDEVDMPIIRESYTAWLLVRQGYMDSTSVAKDAFGRVVTANQSLSPDLKARGMMLEKDIDPSTFFVSMNMQDPLLANRKLRQALSCSFNAQGWVDIFYNGVPPIAQQLIPPGLFSYSQDYRNPNGFNLERARNLLAEAGYPNGRDPHTGQPLTISFDVTATGSEERQMAEYEQRQFEKLGLQINVIENTFAKSLEKEDHGQFQILSGTGWGADYPDPENFYMLFYSKNLPPEGKNVSRYVNPEFDKLFEQMSAMDNTPARLAICDKMRAMLAEDCPVIFTFHKAYYVVVQPWARRTEANMMLEGGLKYQQIDVAMRARLRRDWNHPVLWPLAVLAALVAGAIFYAIRWNRRLNA
jgi:oligopeptide transport system substrate-binding protein